ncbi:Uncharacterised protein [Serratia rubidaea]|uniref:Uncharacterized protein n=1 Tax=Serratia rubidaea TaxID=61652 RepID=A0A447QUP3_SERRU|nr:Uncharacterised protein [Serratia rubidaea]
MLRKLILSPLLIFTSATCAWSAEPGVHRAADILGPAAVAPLERPQPPAKLIVDAPLAGPLRKGAVFIQYRAENLRIEPVYGPRRARWRRASAIFT